MSSNSKAEMITLALTAKFRPDGKVVISSEDMPGFRYLIPAKEGLGEALAIFKNCLNEATFDNPFSNKNLNAEISRHSVVNGLSKARSRGVRLGPPPKMTAEKKATADLLLYQGTPLAEIGKVLGVHRITIARHKASRKREMENTER